MFKIQSLKGFVAAGAIAISLLACDNIYDDPADFKLTGTAEEQSFRLVNCTDYTFWTYFNLHDKDSISLTYDATEIPIDWDIAIHRYDVKTNGAAAKETIFTSLDDLEKAIHDGTYDLTDDNGWQEDEEGEIIIDMSHMMDGYLGTVSSMINTEISKWLNVDTSQMPPIYTPSNKVYLLRFSDNRYAAILFTGFSNPALYNTKGYISFDYRLL